MKKLVVFAMLGIICFTGCDGVKKQMESMGKEMTLKEMIAKQSLDEKHPITIDLNKKYPIIKLEYVCDERGYMYYEQQGVAGKIYLPLFVNGFHGAFQVKCVL